MKVDECILYYDMAQEIGVRPYQFLFPWLSCPFQKNAIDVKMKALWSEHQAKLAAEANDKAKQKSWGKTHTSTSPVQYFNIN